MASSTSKEYLDSFRGNLKAAFEAGCPKGASCAIGNVCVSKLVDPFDENHVATEIVIECSEDCPYKADPFARAGQIMSASFKTNKELDVDSKGHVVRELTSFSVVS